jgi:amino acid transporter
MTEYPDGNQNISDDAELRELGVQPVFKRVLGLFSVSFLAIAFQGPTAAIFTVGIAMIAFLGPSLIWTVPVVLVFQMVIALVWMELSSHYPVEGGIYQWARYLGGEAIGFFSGLTYLTALLILMSALGFGMQAIVIGLFPSIPANTTSQVIVTVALTLLVAIICMMPTQVIARVNSFGVVVELLCLTSFTLIFFFHTHQPLRIINSTAGAVAPGTGNYLVAFGIGMALMVGVLTGSETAGIFAEDSTKARVTPGRATLIACFGVAFFTGLLFFATLLATPNYHQAITNPASWITITLDAAVGSGASKVFLVGAAIAVFSTTLATLMSSSRLMFGMARDRQLPGARGLTYTSARAGQPIVAVIVCSILGVVPLLAANRIPILVSAFTGMFVLTYIMTLGALIYRRMRGWPSSPALLSLGKWGWPLTLIGFAYVIFLAIDFGWKRPSLNPNLGGVPVLWEFVIVVGAFGAIYWFGWLRRMTRTPSSVPVEEKAAQQGGVQGADLTGSLPRHDD